MASRKKPEGNKTLPAKHGTRKGGDGKMHSVVEKTVKRANGKEAVVVTSPSYHVPIVWEWTRERVIAADMIADGKQMSKVAKEIGVDTKTLYNWLQHPDFREYIDKTVLETGMANKTMRVAVMKNLTQKLTNKLMDKLDDVDITPGNITGLLSVADKMMQSLAVEREQLVNLVKAQNTNLNVNSEFDIKDYLKKLQPEQQESVEKLLNQIGDEFIDELE